ncbi:MAG: hypothetical protein ACRDVD_10175 [Acidimicrobiia bacterium]
MELPSRSEIVEALSAAASLHHEYETERLAGVRDELWAGFYAAFVLGRLGGFTTCSALVEVLESVTEQPWAEAAADAVGDYLASSPP